MLVAIGLRALLLVFTLLAVPLYVSGQAISGDLTGTVLDPAGAGIPNARVEAANDATGITSTANTNQSGEYRITNLQAGTYKATAQVQNTYDTKQAEDLPITSVGSGVYNLSLLNAGVSSSGGIGVGSGP